MGFMHSVRLSIVVLDGRAVFCSPVSVLSLGRLSALDPATHTHPAQPILLLFAVAIMSEHTNYLFILTVLVFPRVSVSVFNRVNLDPTDTSLDIRIVSKAN